MCVEDHHTILKASEDLGKAFSKALIEAINLGMNDGKHDSLLAAMQDLERVTRYLKRKAKVIERTQP